MTDLQKWMSDLQFHIFEDDYYVDLYISCLMQCGMTIGKIRLCEYQSDEIVNLCNDFWDALPDNQEIRRNPFNLLCDIAQLCFEEGDA